MTTTNDLYKQVKPDIEAIATPLFDFSELCVRKRGNFLPHAGILTKEGKVELVEATLITERQYTNSEQLLPLLHKVFRKQATIKEIKVIGIAENVTITLAGGSITKAIKVLIEHECGLSVALYLPYRKKFFGSYSFGEIFSVPAKPEVNI